MPKRVLIVEDDQDIRECVAELLESEGYEVWNAANGEEALTHLRSTEHEIPDLILLDLMMPVMDGYEFRAQQKEDPRLRDIPLLLMTAAGGMQAKAAELGAGGGLSKPFKNLDVILEAVRKCLVR